MPDPAAILAKQWPTDGPHDRSRLRSAAEMLPGLLRYATTATDPVNARDTLQVPGDVRHLVVALHDVVGYLPQMLTQLQQTTAGMAESGLLRDERADVEQAWMGAETGRDLASRAGRRAAGRRHVGGASRRSAKPRHPPGQRRTPHRGPDLLGRHAMSGNAEGAGRAAAARLGLSTTEYYDRLNKGLLHCYRCQSWHDAAQFGLDQSRVRGRAASCEALCEPTAGEPEADPEAGTRTAIRSRARG